MNLINKADRVVQCTVLYYGLEVCDVYPARCHRHVCEGRAAGKSWTVRTRNATQTSDRASSPHLAPRRHKLVSQDGKTRRSQDGKLSRVVHAHSLSRMACARTLSPARPAHALTDSTLSQAEHPLTRTAHTHGLTDDGTGFNKGHTLSRTTTHPVTDGTCSHRRHTLLRLCEDEHAMADARRRALKDYRRHIDRRPSGRISRHSPFNHDHL